jgi:N,N-dimethylformamidase
VHGQHALPARDEELIGYCDGWSFAPSERIRIMISATAPDVDVDIVRVRRGDTYGRAPTSSEPMVGAVAGRRVRGGLQTSRIGSCAVVERADVLASASVSAVAWIQATRPGRHEQGIISTLAADGRRGWGLLLDPSGRLSWHVNGEGGRATVAAHHPLLARRWYFVAASYCATRGLARVWFRPRDHDVHGGGPTDLRIDADIGGVDASSHGLLIGAAAPRTSSDAVSWAHGHFDGKIEDPVIADRALDVEQFEALCSGRAVRRILGDTLVAAWNFGRDPGSDRLIDDGPYGIDATAINQPSRAVTGRRWTGRAVDFRSVPDEYRALHFHADDLDDARWRPSMEVVLPESLPSGVYAARLRADGLVDRVPFVVRPARGRSSARLAVLLPTLTYQAYGNERVQFAIADTNPDVTPHDVHHMRVDEWLRRHPEVGLSLYDRHADGSGCRYVSSRRPVPSLRPDYVNWLTASPRHLGADLYLLDWLDHHELQYDVITDHDLHHDGSELLERYAVVMTGSHPEYCTESMLDGLHAYVWDHGGRLMYLGGNGFYWVTSVHAEKPHVMEVRRGHGGTRAWTSDPGETHHSTSGEPGGLWRARGRAPNRLVGVGFAAQGWTPDPAGYVRTEASYDQRWAWIFEGLRHDEVIGDFGVMMSSAVGDEIDRHDHELGSPPGAVVLARARQRSQHYYPAIEDVTALRSGLDGVTNPDVRADMVYFDTRKGGAVFAVGSIHWNGSLPIDHYDNNVSRITRNVVEKFLC